MVFHADLYPGECGQREGLALWVAQSSKKHTCVSPPEWGEVSHPYRYVLYGSPRYVDKRHYRLVCSPIPEDEIDPERNARAQLFWSDPEGFADAVNPPCTAEWVTGLIAELAGLVPEGYSTASDGSAPSPEATKYPEELEAFFAAMDHYGLTGRSHLFPSAGPIDRDEAMSIRSALTDRERDVSGRIARFPKPFRHWVTGLFPITARGHWGLAVDVSTADTRGSVWSYWGGEETLFREFDSLCELLSTACAAYRDGSALRGYVLDTSTGEPRWFLPDKNSGSLFPEPRDMQ